MKFDLQQLLKTFRKKSLTDCAVSMMRCNYASDAIKKIIPHREPFLLVDEITGIDLSGELICGTRPCRVDDPVFSGHFPKNPVYPGCLQLESAGQLGLCLYHFLTNQTKEIPVEMQPLKIFVTKVLGALFLEQVLPGSTMELMSKRLFSDSFTETYIGQVRVEGTICSVFIGELCIM